MSFGYGMVIGHGGWWGTGVPSASSAGKSAVQLLQESKSRYVKSDRVLVSRQEPSRPDRLQINANPNIFHKIAPHTHHALGAHPPVTTAASNPTPPPVPPRSNNVAPLTAVALALHSGPSSCGVALPPPLPSRSSRGVPRPRAKTQPVGDAFPRGGDLRRSLSHGPADRGNDVQMKLRRLLNTDSKESLAVQGPTEETPDKSKAPSGTFRAEVISVSGHKSLPDLVESTRNLDSEPEPHRRPSCPGSITLDVSPKPPPRPPRRSLGESPPKVPARPPPRPPPPKFAPILYAQNGVVRNGLPSTSVGKNPKSGSTSPSLSPSLSAEGGIVNGEETRRRPILRSKSDVTHERPLGGNRWEDIDSRRSSYCSAELEDFFNSMGLDGSTLKLVESPLSGGESSNPPVYFEEMSSEESGPFARRESDDSDELRPPMAPSGGPQSIGRRLTNEPSIVEKNARVIKWLFNCQKARSGAIPRSSSSGS